MKPIVIAVAITGSVPRKRDNPAVPITPAEQVESTHEAFEAGASLVHIHVRNDDETSSSSPERNPRPRSWAETIADTTNLHWKPLAAIRCRDAARVEVGRDRTARHAVGRDPALDVQAQGLSLFGRRRPD
jgi:hypothetical protein